MTVTDAFLRRMVEDLEDGLVLVPGHAPFHPVPIHMHSAIRNYVVSHLKPGEFLTAVLSNDLREAVAHADEHNMRALHDWVYLLHNHVPGQCWGSKDAVMDWTICVLCSGKRCPTCKDTGAAARCDNPGEVWWKGAPRDVV